MYGSQRASELADDSAQLTSHRDVSEGESRKIITRLHIVKIVQLETKYIEVMCFF